MRTVLASFLFVDVVGFSKVSAAEQHAFKAALISVLQRGLAILQPQDYRLRDTGDGALISFLTNPEHALYMALSIAQDCGGEPKPGQVLSLKNLRTGINLGTVKESLDVESRPNFVGDGINAAQRIMDFAQPGQVTASRSFMESMSLLDIAYGEIFGHLGARADKHGRQHELFSVTPNEAVLEKMRINLALNRSEDALDVDLDTPVPLARHPATAPAPAPLPASAAVEPSWLPSQTAADADALADEDTGPSTLNKVMLSIAALSVLVGAVVLGVRYFNGGKRTEASAVSTSAPASPPAPAPGPAAAPATAAPTAPTAGVAPATVAEPAIAASAPVAEPQPAPASTKAAVAAPPAPAALPAPSPPNQVADAPRAKPQEPASRPRRQLAATVTAEPAQRQERAAETPAPVAVTERSDGRCSRIMQKAGVGEPLTSEEKRELANVCR